MKKKETAPEPDREKPVGPAFVPNFTMKCPECGSDTVLTSGCYRCPNCGTTVGCS